MVVAMMMTVKLEVFDVRIVSLLSGVTKTVTRSVTFRPGHYDMMKTMIICSPPYLWGLNMIKYACSSFYGPGEL